MVKTKKILIMFITLSFILYASINIYSELRRDIFVPYPRGIVGIHYELDIKKTYQAVSKEIDGINLDDFLKIIENQKKHKKISYVNRGDIIIVFVDKMFLGLPIGTHVTLFYFNIIDNKVYADHIDWTSVFI